MTMKMTGAYAKEVRRLAAQDAWIHGHGIVKCGTCGWLYAPLTGRSRAEHLDSISKRHCSNCSEKRCSWYPYDLTEEVETKTETTKETEMIQKSTTSEVIENLSIAFGIVAVLAGLLFGVDYGIGRDHDRAMEKLAYEAQLEQDPSAAFVAYTDCGHECVECMIEQR